MTPSTAVTTLAQADMLLLAASILDPSGSDTGRWRGIDAATAGELANRAGLEDRSPFTHALSRLDTLAESERHAELCRLFESPGICPANETVFIRRDKGAILADICGFYQAFGFAHVAAHGEKADFIACELEFVAMLLVMAVRADLDDQPDRAEICRGALASFASDHLGEWIEPFCERLAVSAGVDAIGGTADWLAGLWQSITRDQDLPAPVVAMEAFPVVDQGDPYECGLDPEHPA